MAQSADRAAPRIELGPASRAVGQRIVLSVVAADAVAQFTVAAGDPELLHPAVLVRRHRLAGQLPAEPGVLLGEDDPPTGSNGGESGCDTAQTAADHEHVRIELRHRLPSAPGPSEHSELRRSAVGAMEDRSVNSNGRSSAARLD